LTLPVQLQSFHEAHGHLTEFAGFNLPLWFTGIIPESLAVRNTAGLFDVSHMGRALIAGDDSERLLQHITSNDVSTLTQGRGQYSLLCNPDGGIRDDVLVLKLQKNGYLIVYNAANRTADFNWFIANRRGFEVEIEDISNEVALFAVQGPRAASLVQEVTHDPRLAELPRFGCSWGKIERRRVLLSRTGYTGEDGFEVYVWDSPIDNPRNAETVWNELLNAGKAMSLELCGLGARDLLRLEAGLCLYGTDIDEKTNPFEARLGFVVKLQKDFIGRSKLQEIKTNGPERLRVGLVTENRVIPRHGFRIANHDEEIGVVTSGTLSPIIKTGIAMGYVGRASAKEDARVEIRIRDRYEGAKITKLPFYDTTKYGYSRTAFQNDLSS
jgi:glycine cleavage system T protein (aminomethyltransferase)